MSIYSLSKYLVKSWVVAAGLAAAANGRARSAGPPQIRGGFATVAGNERDIPSPAGHGGRITGRERHMDKPRSGSNIEPLIKNLQAIVGADRVITDPKERAYYSNDVFYQQESADIVVQPADKDQLARAVAEAVRTGYTVVPRGGGMSYTAGYVPDRAASMIVDTKRLNRIIEINAEDMYVTVECGVTWKQLYEALKEKGLRTPYFGPFSGIHATVGGALSQNSVFFGSGIYGPVSDSVLGLEVALADGRLIKTGSAATPFNPSPFFRTYGPDLTGMFLADTGALGFKVQATLKLIHFPAVQLFASFSFDEDAHLVGAMSEVARRGLAQECYGFDPYLLELRMKFEGLAQDIKSLGALVRSGKSLLGGLKDAAKVAVAGRRFMEGVSYAMHVTVEGRDKADAESALKQVREIATKHGREIENSLPKLVRANPFVPTNRLLGPEGQRWVPIHVILPHSRVVPMLRALDRYFQDNAKLVEDNGIEWGYLSTVIGPTAFLCEPTFFWPDSHYQVHQRHIEPAHYAKLKRFPENLKAREAMGKIRKDLAKLFMEFGSIHLQIGKMYPYRDSRDPTTYALLQAVKDYVDPHHLMNPGSLGLT
ncbi:MAG: FAD-binding oxidoreductase [Alphaproteobacteria bacterium]|nr:FAD-binding oxidoreductase [Alphaproteobacteria bacterium]